MRALDSENRKPEELPQIFTDEFLKWFEKEYHCEAETLVLFRQTVPGIEMEQVHIDFTDDNPEEEIEIELVLPKQQEKWIKERAKEESLSVNKYILEILTEEIGDGKERCCEVKECQSPSYLCSGCHCEHKECIKSRL